jgi:hypothetical protein
VLLAVDGPTNGAKSDDDASDWLPPRRAYDCIYAKKQIAIKTKYRLWVELDEKLALRRTTRDAAPRGGPGLLGPRLASTGLAKLATLALLVALAVPVVGAHGAVEHRNPCHTRHECPSDHATYRWRGLLCVSSTADERTLRFRKKVVYGGRIYYCHR